MKKFILLYILSTLLLICCHQTPTFDNDIRDKYEVCFQLELSTSIIPFPDSRGIPGFPPEPNVEVYRSSFKYLYYVVMDSATKEIIEENQIAREDKTDDFGSYLYLNLPAGSYQITIITHDSGETGLEGTLFRITDLMDTFSGTSAFTIEDQKKVTSITLSRKVSRVEFIATDEIPSEVKEFCISILTQYQTIDIETGNPTSDKQNHLYTYTFSEEEKAEKTSITHFFYTFVPTISNNKLSSVELIVKGENNAVLYKKNITDVPVYANRITQYTGLLYSSGMSDGTFDLNFDDEGMWGGTDPYPLP